MNALRYLCASYKYWSMLEIKLIHANKTLTVKNYIFATLKLNKTKVNGK